MEGPERANNNEKSSTGDKVVAAAALGAAVFAGMSDNADARVTPGTADTAEKNPVIAAKQNELNSSPMVKGVLKDGTTFVIERQTGLGRALELKTSDGKVLLSVPTGLGKGENPDEDMMKILTRMTPEKVAFELQAGRDPRIDETVEGTRITVTPYAHSLMKYMGVSYSAGKLSFGGSTMDLTKDETTRNETVDIMGLLLENKLVACVMEYGRGGKSVDKLVYFITKDGTKYALSQGDAKEVPKYCK